MQDTINREIQIKLHQKKFFLQQHGPQMIYAYLKVERNDIQLIIAI